MFVLKTLSDKYIKEKKLKLYSCFVDFEKAFDKVWRMGLLLKLEEAGIRGKFYNVIKQMYTDVRWCVKTQDKRTNLYQSNVGVKQGDIISPFLFNIYLNDLPNFIGTNEDTPTLTNQPIYCLMYADDLILLSTSPCGLQNS